MFDGPLPFAEALAARAVRTLLPTELRTRDLAGQAPALLNRSAWSAGIQNAELLQKFEDMTAARLNGKTNLATARLELKQFMGTLGVDVDETDLTDIRSDARLNLKLEHDLASAQGYGQALQGNDPAVRNQWPALELIDTNPGQTENRRDWAAIWANAINELGSATKAVFFGNRMIAPLDDPIWSFISDFGNPYAPFKFRSYWEQASVDRTTAVEAGVIGEDEDAKPMPLEDFNAELQAKPEVREEWLRSALADSLQGVAEFAADGVLRFTGGAS
ncbi:MAG: hypothetical protein H7067_15320 [Burkholderiales bacterium]|nr:hypothetical protein [Opitutaceae bacterium]